MSLRHCRTAIATIVFVVVGVSCVTVALGQAAQPDMTGLGERVVRFPADFSIGRYVLIDEEDGVDGDGTVRLSGTNTSTGPVAKRCRFDTWPYPGLGFNSGEAQGEIHVPKGTPINLLIRCKDTRFLSRLGPDAIQHLLIERRRGSGGLYGYVLEDIEHLTGLRALTLHAWTYNAMYGYAGWGPIPFGDGDLESLKKLRSLRYLDLSRTTFPDAALRHIVDLKSLRVLDLSSTNVTETALERLAAMPQLESLDLRRVRLSAGGLAHLKRLPALKELALGPISAAAPGLGHLQHLTALTHLRIEFKDASDNALRRFRPPPNLQHLELNSERPISDAGLKSLAGLGRLKSLALWLPVNLDGPGLRKLEALEDLDELSIKSVPSATDGGLASLAGLTQIERLSVFSVADVAALMRHLDGHPNLVELGVSGELDPEAEIPNLPKGMPRLRRVRVPATINVERYAHPWTALVAQFTSLEELDLYTIDLSNRQMRLLENLKQLKRLKIKPNAADAGMESLSRLGSLEHLVLRNGHEYSDGGLKHLGRMTALKSLSMTGGGGRFSDAGMAHFENLTSLETLDLEGSYYVKDGAVKHLGHLSQLKRLNVRRTRMTADGIARLRQALPNCQILDSFPDSRSLPDALTGMSNSKPLTFEQLALLKEITNLEHLSVKTDQFTDIGLEHLKDLKNVASLELSSTRITDAELVQLKGLTNLRNLGLGSNVTDAGLEHLTGLTCLQCLDLSHTQVTTSGLRHLKGLINLQKLWPPKHAGLKHLSGLTSLQELYLSRTQVTDAELEHLAGLTNLRVLYARGPEVSDAGLEHLKGLTNLRVLALSDTRVTSTGLQHLKGLTELRSLGLHRTQVTDAGLVYLQGLSNLETLGLDSNKVTDAGMKHLGGLTKLKCLMLKNTQVTDAGLVHLKRLRDLSDLRLSGTRVTDEGIESLQKDLPNIDR